MKLIVREYLASLKERDELDAILPDLLSQLGLNVFSRPGRGTRQDGVDIGAVGKLDGTVEKVYLFSVKAGDLTRREWDGDAIQSLRPSLNEILDAYIPNRLPTEHRNKPVVICVCVGGDIQEQVRPSLEGFISQNKKPLLSFEEWNGDKLASLIQASFLREDLLQHGAQSQLRKSLAMLDDPDTSHRHFSKLLRMLADVKASKPSQRLIAIRQISICLWILFAWGREAQNMESAYRSSELALLLSWQIARLYVNKKSKIAERINSAFLSILLSYNQICTEYLVKRILPHAEKRDALSSAVRSPNSLDVNLKLFDVLGRIAMGGLWQVWHARLLSDDDIDDRKELWAQHDRLAYLLKAFIANNPTLNSPIKDDQAIDIWIAIFFLSLNRQNRDFVDNWLNEIISRAHFAYVTHGKYPANLYAYNELLNHPKFGDTEYRENVTAGSILYPMIASWAAFYELDDLYNEVTEFKSGCLQHCNFQFWFPDNFSETHFYDNSEPHGMVLSAVSTEQKMAEFLANLFAECEQSLEYENLSSVRSGLWPIILVACRHYRLPPPIHLMKELHSS